MRKLAEVLRLRFELKLSYQQIARSCSIALSSVHKYLTHAQAAGLSWPLPEGWNEAKLKAALFPPNPAIVEPAQRTAPDFAALIISFSGFTGLGPVGISSPFGWLTS